MLDGDPVEVLDVVPLNSDHVHPMKNVYFVQVHGYQAGSTSTL